MKTIVVSDIHLGYTNSNSQQFARFVDDIFKRDDIESLVILGDFIDMWRRDASGLFLEFNYITDKILSLKNKIKVYCIAGNHDYHLLQLKNHGYPLVFLENLTLQGNDITYNFMHGWEFDMAQQKFMMESLCHNMSDEEGQIRSEAWKKLQSAEGVFDKLKHLFQRHGDMGKIIDHLMTQPLERLSNEIDLVERKAYEKTKDGQILVFGHTHKPFVSSDKKLVNSGSWVSDAKVPNTYVELDGKEINLIQYGTGDLTGNDYTRKF